MISTSLARHEHKFIIDSELMEPIRAFIRPYCNLDTHGPRETGGFYTITCLYLDSDRYRMFWDAERRLRVRAKLRVRAYGNRTDVVKLEIKRRIEDLVVKSSVLVADCSWTRLLAAPACAVGGDLDEADRIAIDEFATTVRTLGAGPKMLVRYERQAFESSSDDYVRITFDRDLEFQPMTDWNLRGWPCKWQPISTSASGANRGAGVVLELKFPDKGAPEWLADLVQVFGLVPIGNSKYGSAVRSSTVCAAMPCRVVPPLQPSQWLT